MTREQGKSKALERSLAATRGQVTKLRAERTDLRRLVEDQTDSIAQLTQESAFYSQAYDRQRQRNVWKENALYVGITVLMLLIVLGVLSGAISC